MEYFYTPPNCITGDELVLDGEEFSHLTHVMRKQVGDTIRVVDGCGQVYDVRIIEVRKHLARCSILARQERLHEPPTELTVAAALLKSPSRFDYLVEKTTELGTRRIIPLLTKRTIPRSGKRDRWQKLAISAMKQSTRCVLPTITELMSFADFVSAVSPESLKLIPHQEVERQISDVHRGQPSIIICIGPEGGFTDEELDRASEAGFISVTLGPRRLRAETAAVVASAAVLT